VARCLVDEKGLRLFTDAEVSAVGAKDGTVVDRLFDVCKRLNKLDAADVEGAAGN
jgi:hypothetical protein